MRAMRSKMWGLLVLAAISCAEEKGQEPVPTLDILQVLPAASRIEVGGSVQLGAQRVIGLTASNVTSSVRWSSDNEQVVTVSYDKEAGAVATAVGPGTAHIKADDNGVTAEAEFVVDAGIASLELDTGVFELARGTSKPWGATLLGEDGSKRELDSGTWGSSDTAIASVDSKGVVTGVGVGQASITLTRDGLTTTQTVFVRDWTLESIDARVVGGTSLLAGSSAPIRVTGTFTGGRTQNITSLFTFSVERPDPAKTPPVSVDGSTISVAEETGGGTVKGAGKASSIAAGQSVTFEISIVDPTKLESLSLDVPESASTQGEVLPFSVTGNYGGDVDLETAADEITAEPKELVYVDKASGTILPLKAGTVKITVTTTLNGDDEDESNDVEISDAAEITIVDAAVSGVTLALASETDTETVAVGETTQLSATASFGEASSDVTEPAIWTSSDPSVAVVSNVTAGRVTGLKAGKATIRATYQEQSGTFEITVQ